MLRAYVLLLGITGILLQDRIASEQRQSFSDKASEVARGFSYLYQPCRYAVRTRFFFGSVELVPVVTEKVAESAAARIVHLVRGLSPIASLDHLPVTPPDFSELEQLVDEATTETCKMGLERFSTDICIDDGVLETQFDTKHSIVTTDRCTLVLDRPNNQLSILPPATYFVSGIDSVLEPLSRDPQLGYKAPWSLLSSARDPQVVELLPKQEGNVSAAVWLLKDVFLPFACFVGDEAAGSFMYCQISYQSHHSTHSLVPRKIVRVVINGSKLILRVFELSEFELATSEDVIRLQVDRRTLIVDHRFDPALQDAAWRFKLPDEARGFVDVNK
jgi:hypothetical protein